MKPFRRFPMLILATCFSASLHFAQKVSEVRLDVGDDAGAHPSRNPRIAASGSSIYVAWEDYRLPFYRGIFFNRSLDGGETWLPSDERLDAHGAANPQDAAWPRIAASGSLLCAVWSDSSGSFGVLPDIYFDRSLDGGSTWLPAKVRLDSGKAPLSTPSERPVIALSGLAV